jgi:hypothetical protein
LVSNILQKLFKLTGYNNRRIEARWIIRAEEASMKEVKVVVILKLPDHAPVQPWPRQTKVNPDYSAAIWSLLRDMQSQDNLPEAVES